MMQLRLVESPNYSGLEGVLHVRTLQHELNSALAAGDWHKVRRLDRSCGAVVDKLITANEGDAQAIANALGELKSVYANLIARCKHEVASLAH